ncbi:F-box-like domain superfamily [Arabidopsis thaliana x Arabidopsis arenosa]|uniref:F-box-like domain superfamily n=1 Tax=Arabidopsis thaliana x Arabidopsis arenosa TaxID=1240361 RepID=A0A8T1YDW0_9BRAS|nr:F-box-like domain superfamily [Arabidopsis thaliana x Arabidopsis arenosa]KAG7544090.1 F-box-like domain superfamily [Arabidopsis thaliana x Arabidopsis arenosa]
MAKISDLSDELLVKILSFLPTKVAVSTSVLSKQWMFIWMWLPKLEFGFSRRSKYACLRDFIDKNLPLHKAPIIESLYLDSFFGSLQPEDMKSWVGIAVSRYVRELSIDYSSLYDRSVALLPCSLYRCKSLVTLKLIGEKILVDVPPTVCLPSLKTLRLDYVTYSKDESLRLLLSYCPVLEDLFIDSDYYPKLVNIPENVSCSLYSWKSLVTLKLQGEKILVNVPPTVCLPSLKTLQLLCVTYLNEESLGLLLSCCALLEDLSIERDCNDNVKALVVVVPSLQRLTLTIEQGCSADGYVIVTPSLKYFYLVDKRSESSCLIEHMHMPELEEADISLMEDIEKDIEMLFKSITTVKRLSLNMSFNGGKETVHRDGIVFSQLEDLKLYIRSDNWSKLLVHLLKHSPNLQILNLLLDDLFNGGYRNYEPVGWSNNQSSVPECFLNSLETFKFNGYNSREAEDRDFLSFIFKHARCLKSTSIVHV